MCPNVRPARRQPRQQQTLCGCVRILSWSPSSCSRRSLRQTCSEPTVCLLGAISCFTFAFSSTLVLFLLFSLFCLIRICVCLIVFSFVFTGLEVRSPNTAGSELTPASHLTALFTDPVISPRTRAPRPLRGHALATTAPVPPPLPQCHCSDHVLFGDSHSG